MIHFSLKTVSKTFLKTLGIDGHTKKSKILFDEFLLGRKSKTLTNYEQNLLENLKERMKTAYEWDESKTKVWHFIGQNCSDMMISVDWKSYRFKSKQFYPASKYATDYGACCAIFPFMDFENSTSGIARNGLTNGMFLALDIESYDYGFFSRRSEGFRVATSNAFDTPIGDGSGFPGFVIRFKI